MFYNFDVNQIQAELLKSVRFVFCVIIMVIPWMLCFLSFLTISYRFPGCFRMVSAWFPWRFYNFLGCFYCFPSVFPPFPILNFVIKVLLYFDLFLQVCNSNTLNKNYNIFQITRFNHTMIFFKLIHQYKLSDIYISHNNCPGHMLITQLL